MTKLYQSMKKEDKKKNKKVFWASAMGKELKKLIIIILICALFCLIISITMFIKAIIGYYPFWKKFYALIIFGFGIAFLLGAYYVFLKHINKFINKK